MILQYYYTLENMSNYASTLITKYSSFPIKNQGIFPERCLSESKKQDRFYKVFRLSFSDFFRIFVRTASFFKIEG